MRTVTNFFLANLAVADLCVGIFCVLPNLSIHLSPVWKLGRIMCKTYHFVQSMSYTASVGTLTVISAERYFAIIHPIKSKQVTRIWLLRIIVVIIWLVSAGQAVPFLLYYDEIQIPQTDITYCLLFHKFNIQVYVSVGFILEYAIPLILMCGAYVRISIVLWKTSRQAGFKMKDSDKGGKTVQVSENKGHSNSSAYAPVLRVTSPSSETEDIEEDLLSGDGYPTNRLTKSIQIHDIDDHEPARGNLSDETSNIDKPNQDKYRQKLVTNNCSGSKTTTKPSSRDTKIAAKKKNNKKKVEGALLARRKVIRLLIVVIIAFAICVLPYRIRVIWLAWGKPSLSFFATLASPLSFLIYYFNSALNPLLYAFLSDNFRRSLKEVLTCQDGRNVATTSKSYASSTSMRTMNTSVM